MNASLITGLSSPEEILILGSDIFVTNFLAGTVGEYTSSGGTVNAALISGLDGGLGIATDGTNLYVTNPLARHCIRVHHLRGFGERSADLRTERPRRHRRVLHSGPRAGESRTPGCRSGGYRILAA